MIALKTRLALTYTLFTSLALILLIVSLNIFADWIFESFVKKSIQKKNAEIVTSVTELYRPSSGFDMRSLESVGMLFVHDGYIIDVVDLNGATVWNARSMNMRHCVEVLRRISDRMEREYGVKGGLHNASYPIVSNAALVAHVNITSFGPFFYTEAESEFLVSLNRLLVAAACAFVFLAIVVSFILARTVAAPVLAASNAARNLARFYALPHNGKPDVYLKEDSKTYELHELSRSINALGSELAEAELRQKQLTMDVAHELRTPLSALQGTLEAVIDGVWETSTERLALCLAETKRLAKMTEDLQILASLEWEKAVLHKEKFDISSLLCSVAEQYTPHANDKGIAIVLETVNADVYADYNRIRQVIVNLLSNALHYTARGTITIVCERNAAGIAIKICDTGEGIAADELPRIFERFYRTDKSRSRNTGGSGIGLAVSAAILRAHGWDIHAESEVGKGSVFTVTVHTEA